MRALPFLALLFLPCCSFAAPVTIGDPSFEGNGLASGGWSNDLSPEWQETGGPSNGAGFEEYIENFAAEGTDHLGMGSGHAVWQDLGQTYQANTVYTLTISAGRRSGQSSPGNQTTYALESPGGTTFASAFFDASTIPGGTFSDAPDLVFDTTSNPAAVGQTIRVVLSGGGPGRSHFDNIRLDATEAEPDGSATVSNSLATGVASTTATLNGSVTDVGDGAPTITIFYGTSDGGTEPSAWDASTNLSGTQSGFFSATVSSLAPSQSYFFTARATNSSGTSWASPSLSFETTANPPQVTLGPLTDLTADSAEVPVTIVDNGGDQASVIVYFGTTNGGTTPGNWQSSVSLGTVPNSATAILTGLSPNTGYFARALATNEGGSSWTPFTASFTTAVVLPPSIENNAVGSLTAVSAALRGEVTDTGFQTPTVTLYYGTSDGGTTPGNWDSSLLVGSEDGNYSRFVSGLLPNTTYFYTASAVNGAGTTWASPTESFTTPDALAAQVVINEIHYNPADETSAEEFIELYNPGTTSLDLSGWSLTDAVEFTFPPGTTIPANGYLVVAEDPGTLLSIYGVTAIGPWSGGLRNDGEEIDLRDGSGTLQDQVDYGSGFPWPTGAQGGGGSMELLNAALDNDLGGSWRTSGSTIDSGPGPETTYVAPADTSWRYRKGTSEASSPTSAWRTIGFNEDATWTTGQTPIGYGDGDDNTVLSDMRSNYWSVYLRREFVVDPLEIPQQLRLRLYVDDGAVVWINGQEVERAHVPSGDLAFDDAAQNHEAAWEEFILTGANTYLVGGTNVIAVHALNGTLTSSDFSIDVSLEATNQTSSGGGNPTPGAPNSSSSTPTPPAIRQVDHFPESPTSSDSVTITAKLTDPDGMGPVTLEYQIVDPGSYIRREDAAYDTSWTGVPMSDNGTDGDALAGDSIYTVILPASLQNHRRLIRYRIQFEDANGTSAIAPYEDDEQPNFAYFVYDGIPSWSASFTPGSTNETFPADLMDDLPVYHLIANSTDVNNSQYRGSSDGVRMSGTLVYNGEVYDHIEFKNRGEASTYVAGKNKWRIFFNRARRFEAIDNWGERYDSNWTRLNVQPISSPWAAINRGMAGLDESLTMRLYEMAGVPAPRTHYFSFRVIDNAAEANPSDQYAGDVWGLYLAMESPNGSFLDDRNLADGNIYKIEGGNGDKKEQGNTQVTNSSDWSSFYSASNSAQTEQWWRDHMNMPVYYSMRALNRLLGNVDIRIGYNHYFYHEPTQDQWWVIPWDLDMMYIAETHQAGVIRQQNSILNHPQLRIEFRNRAREILDLVGSNALPGGGQIGQLIDEYADIVNPPEKPLTWADVDAFMWNRHPRTRGSLGSTSGQSNHLGNFYASPYTDSRFGGSYTRVLQSQDHEGFVNHIVNYTTDTFPGGSWSPGNGVPAGYGYEYLKFEANDSGIPNKPVITYNGPASFPVNQLNFTSSTFSDPNGNNTFGKMRWRIARILAPGLPGYVSNTPRTYEIETMATSPDLNSFTADYLFPADTAEPGITYRVRVQHEDSTGRTSHWSDPIEFVSGLPDVSIWQDNLVISEIMYNPPQPTGAEVAVSSDNDDFEFIELTNISETVTLDLSELDFTNGITFDFSTATSTTLAPGESAILVKNQAAFEARYGFGLPVIGTYPNSLSNGGEQVTLSFALNTPVIDFVYDDNAPWPTSPDGEGFSLVLLNPETAPDSSLPSSWTSGSVSGGTPGGTEPDTSSLQQYLTQYLTPAQMANPALAGPLADPDFDGFSNLLEYALGGHPLIFAPLVTQSTVTHLGSDYPALTFLRRNDNPSLLIEAQVSSDLLTWNEGGSHLIEESAVDQGDGTTLVTIRSLSALNSPDDQFLRVRIFQSNP